MLFTFDCVQYPCSCSRLTCIILHFQEWLLVTLRERLKMCWVWIWFYVSWVECSTLIVWINFLCSWPSRCVLVVLITGGFTAENGRITFQNAYFVYHQYGMRRVIHYPHTKGNMSCTVLLCCRIVNRGLSKVIVSVQCEACRSLLINSGKPEFSSNK